MDEDQRLQHLQETMEDLFERNNIEDILYHLGVLCEDRARKAGTNWQNGLIRRFWERTAKHLKAIAGFAERPLPDMKEWSEQYRPLDMKE